MTDDKWEQLVELAKQHFKNVSLHTEELEQGTEDILEFENPSGKFQVVRENTPVVLEKKQHYTHRPGDTARTEYKFSDTELAHKIYVYKEDYNGEWEEVTLDKLGL